MKTLITEEKFNYLQRTVQKVVKIQRWFTERFFFMSERFKTKNHHGSEFNMQKLAARSRKPNASQNLFYVCLIGVCKWLKFQQIMFGSSEQ